MQRVIVYVDGFNLYFGLKASGFKRYYWLNIAALAQNLLKPGQQLCATHYFTTRIRGNGRNTADQKRQNDYLEALAMHGVLCHFGHYPQKTRQCRQCGASWLDYEEKMTDVNLAIQVLADAFDDGFDTAIVVSGDSDLMTPLRKVRERFIRKRIVVAFPPGRYSNEIKRCAHGFFTIGEDKLRASQLPERVNKPDGYVLHRPATWR